MLVEGINLPEELLRAQATGDLVIFIGAGVSAPTPSSLPLFDELARQVGEGTGLQRGEHESVDHYFGRLKLGGVQVHKAVAGILLNPTWYATTSRNEAGWIPRNVGANSGSCSRRRDYRAD